MHIFQLVLEAGPEQATYCEGEKIAAVCMVNSEDTELARNRACDRLFELGWRAATFEKTVVLPPSGNIDHFDALMAESYKDAKRLGVSLIEFPEPKGAT